MFTVLSSLPNDLAREISSGREKLGLTQIQLAEAVGVSMRSVQNWEAGTTAPRPKHRQALVALFATVAESEQAA